MLHSSGRTLWTRIPTAPLVCSVLGLMGGYLAVTQTKLAIALLAVGALVGVFATSPISIALLAAPSSFYTGRLSIGHGVSLPDVVLAIATLLSLPAVARLGMPRGVTKVRRWLAVYVMAMAVIVALHPSGRSLLEAAHRTVLVGGALSVGAWIYLEGKSRLALRLLVAVAVVVGALCIVVGAAHGFRLAAQPIGLNKNYVGSVLGLSMLVGLAAPGELQLPKVWVNAGLVVMGGGLAATHSRASMLAFALGVLVWFFRSHSEYRRRSFITAALLAVGFLVLGGFLVKDQLSNKTATLNTNSVAVRNKTEAATRALWRTSPVIGVGISYYNDPRYQQINHFLVAPANGIDEALAEGGIVLATGFILFQVGALSVIVRYRNPLAVAGLALVSDRILQGMVDIYWTAGNSSLPWIIIGMGLAQAAAGGRVSDPLTEVVGASIIPRPASL